MESKKLYFRDIKKASVKRSRSGKQYLNVKINDVADKATWQAIYMNYLVESLDSDTVRLFWNCQPNIINNYRDENNKTRN